MQDTFSDFRRVMDELAAPLGDYAPVARQLLADYKDGGGRDYNQSLLTYHSPGATDAELVASVRDTLAGRGCKLTALMEFLNGGGRRVLFLDKAYLLEALQELGLPVPDDLTAALRAAGVHPVNWEGL